MGFRAVFTGVISRFIRFIILQFGQRFVCGITEQLQKDSVLEIETGSVPIKFYSPNSLTAWRALSLLEKEPETISWIESLKDSLIPGTEGTIKVGGIRAIKFDIAMDDERGIFSKQRIIVRNHGRLYAFTGNGETFEEILDSFRFINEKESQPE